MNAVKLQHFLEASARRFPEKAALVCGERRWSYREINQASERLAGGLRGLGIQPGDRVAFLLENSLELVIGIFGALKAGAVFMVLNPAVKGKKLRYILEDSKARLLVAHGNLMDVVSETLMEMNDEKPGIIRVGGERKNLKNIPFQYPWDGLFRPNNGLDRLPDSSLQAPYRKRCIELDLASLIYTSGSTGNPKAVMSPHSSMVAASQSIIEYLENDKDDVILNVLPLSFDYGLYQLLMTFIFGGTLILEPSFAYPGKILNIIKREKVTGFPIVPTIAAILMRLKGIKGSDLSSVRYVTSTGAPLSTKAIGFLRDVFEKARIYSMYGLTECKRVSYLPPDMLDKKPESVGIPIPGCRVSVVDEGGRELPPGEVGELVVRGPNVMAGYWEDPELTKRTFRRADGTDERILYTGDLFRRDNEGFLYFVGRKDDMIKCKGERVSPREVENALMELEDVVEAAVVGVPDPILGEAVRAFVVVRKGSQLSEREVLRHAERRLEDFMVPKSVVFMESLPKTPHGKTDKRKLKSGEAVNC